MHFGCEKWKLPLYGTNQREKGIHGSITRVTIEAFTDYLSELPSGQREEWASVSAKTQTLTSVVDQEGLEYHGNSCVSRCVSQTPSCTLAEELAPTISV